MESEVNCWNTGPYLWMARAHLPLSNGLCTIRALHGCWALAGCPDVVHKGYIFLKCENYIWYRFCSTRINLFFLEDKWPRDHWLLSIINFHDMKEMGDIGSHLVFYFHFLDNGLGVMSQQMWVERREETRNRIEYKIFTTKLPKKVKLALLWYDHLLKYRINAQEQC